VVCYLHHVVCGGARQAEVLRALDAKSKAAIPHEYLSAVHVCVTRVETSWAPLGAPGDEPALQQSVTLEWQAPAVRGSAGPRAAHAAAMAQLPLAEGGPVMAMYGGVGYNPGRAGHLFVLALDGAPERFAAASGAPDAGARGGATLVAGWARELSFAWHAPICLGTAPPACWGHTLTPLHTMLAPAPVAGGEGAFAPAALCARTLVLFGGTEAAAAEPQKFNDVFLVTLSKPPEAGVYTASWSKPLFASRPVPSPRERHAAFYAPAWTATQWGLDAPRGGAVHGAIVIFGGYGEGYQDDDDDDDEAIDEEDEE
jgi:hypothetical protein